MAVVKKRIHQLASDWGVKSSDVIERLEKMGVTGKKAQSSLTEPEADRVYDAMGLSEPTPEERVVTTRKVEVGAAGVSETVVTETRIRPGVTLRRTKRSGPGADAATGGVVPRAIRRRVATAGKISPLSLNAFDSSDFAYATVPLGAAYATAVEPILDPSALSGPVVGLDVPAVDTSPAAEAEHESSAEAGDGVARTGSSAEASAAAVTPEADTCLDDDTIDAPVEEPDKLAEEMLRAAAEREERERLEREEQERLAREAEEAAAAAAAAAEAEAEAARLAKKEAGGKDSTERSLLTPTGPRVLGKIDLKAKQQAAQPEKPAGEAKPADREATGPGRKRKRKVVRKEDMFDAFERSFQAQTRRPIKRRVAPGQRIQKTELTVPSARKRVVKINEITTAGEMAKSMGIKAGEVLGALMKLGVMKSINDALDVETAELVADEFGYTVENTAVSVEDLLKRGPEQAEDGSLESRPPVVTVMGHVDHGKTSLLDVIREANVVAGEAGGITQHIGAYMVPTGQGEICFLDTPGHAAFTEMRARGASLTDIVILVVAADDGVMPQTIEAVSHARAAEIPVVVAVNKMDKPDANPDRVKQQLSEYGLQPEDWGGDTQFVPVSALKKDGIDNLLESVALLSQILELKAPVDKPAQGIVIEARLDKGRGPVATVLIQEGNLKRGQHFVVGETTGRVRAMNDHTGAQVKTAGPSHAVEIIGLDAVPQAGDAFDVVEDASRAEQVAERRREHAKAQQKAVTARMSLEDLQAQVAAGDVNELKVIIKADVHGSAEALKQALEKLATTEVKLDVIHIGVGAINESDVQLGRASNAVIIGFHVRPEGKARILAEREAVDLRLHTIIYEAIDEMKAALEGLLAPEFKEAIEGRAEVRDTFNVPGGVTIAGCYVTDGNVKRTSQCRLLRDNVVIHTGAVGSLRRFKDDVKEVQTGFECGIGIERFNDLKPGDVIECFRMDEIKRSLDDVSQGAGASAPA